MPTPADVDSKSAAVLASVDALGSDSVLTELLVMTYSGTWWMPSTPENRVPGTLSSDHRLNRFADKPIERTVSIQLSGYLGRRSRLIRSRSKLAVTAGDGARTRSFNLGKVRVHLCIQAPPIHLSRYLSTHVFERGHVAFASHHRPINWRGH
jgi:hypothetical protein